MDVSLTVSAWKMKADGMLELRREASEAIKVDEDGVAEIFNAGSREQREVHK